MLKVKKMICKHSNSRLMKEIITEVFRNSVDIIDYLYTYVLNWYLH